MFVPLIIFLFAGLLVATLLVNAAEARIAATRLGSSLLGASSVATGIATAVFAISLVTPRSALADGNVGDKAPDARSSSSPETDKNPADPSNAESSSPGANSPGSSQQGPSVPTPEAPEASESSRDPLNTPPLATVQIDRAKRPSWVESAAVQFGDVQTIAVKGGPYPSQRECLRALDGELQKATDEFIADYLGNSHAPSLLNYDLRHIKEHFVQDKVYDEIIVSPLVGEMRQTHALLQFDTEFRHELDDRWAQLKAASRLGQVGLGVGAALAFLGTFLGYLRMDTATRGYYTGRLQFAAATTILAIVAAGVVAAKWIPWQ